MKRRAFCGALLGLPLAVRAQGKTPVIGLLWNDSVKPSPYVATLVSALAKKGYVAGRDLRIEDGIALEGYAAMEKNAADLVRRRVDLLVTYGGTATIAAAKATRNIPIAMIFGGDPVSAGWVKSLAQPGGNVTGIVTLSVGLNAKRLELLKELHPRMTRLGILYAPGSAVQASLRDSQQAAEKLKLKVTLSVARTPEEIEVAVDALEKAKVEAIYVGPSTQLASHSARVVAAVEKARLPAIYGVDRYIAASGLMVYGPSVQKTFVRLGDYVDRILRGARPAHMPVEQVSDVDLVINLKAAQALGIRFPHSILQRADRAIE